MVTLLSQFMVTLVRFRCTTKLIGTRGSQAQCQKPHQILEWSTCVAIMFSGEYLLIVWCFP